MKGWWEMSKYVIDLKGDKGVINGRGIKSIIVCDAIGREFHNCELLPYEEPEAEAEEEKPKKWRADVGHHYYYLDSVGDIGKIIDNTCMFDNWRYLSGNYFKARDEAGFYKESLLVYNELKEYAVPNDEQVWDGNMPHWYLCYDTIYHYIDATNSYFNKQNDLCFASRDIAKQAATAVGEDRVKKYYLKVND